jgi:hypothetical protein
MITALDSQAGAGPAVGPPGGLNFKRPPGPPPGGVPLNALKPPPRAPPPLALNQTAQRPGIEPSVKRPGSPSNAGSDPKKAHTDGAPDAAQSKIPATYVVPAPKKQGAIAMFEEPNEPPAAKADAKSAAPIAATVAAQATPPPGGAPPPRGPPRGPPGGPPPGAPGGPGGLGPPGPMNRVPRPLPPRPNAPGIPEGQPLPPGGKPAEATRVPAPVRPPPRGPGGGRAPPAEDPQTYEQRKELKITPPAPTSEPPLLRVKKVHEPEVVKRRERDMPEFDSSDEDEEAPNFVKQPLPFGVLKQPLPKTKAERDADEERARKEAAAKAALIASEYVMDSGAAAPPLGAQGRQLSMMSAGSASTAQPSQAPRENKLSGFVPPPPSVQAAKIDLNAPTGTDIGKHYDDSKLGASLTRGRLSIRCIEGHDIRRKDDQEKVPRNDSFIRFRLGVAERHPWKNTETKRKQDSNPKFDDEIIFFDITDPAQFVFQEDLQLCIELWNKSTTKNELVGTVTMSVVRFFKKPFVSFTEKVPIYYPGATRTPMKVCSYLS